MSVPAADFAYVEARLRVRPTGEGGRSGPVFAGYRAGWWVPGRDGRRRYTDGAVYPIDTDELEPGATGRVRIVPLIQENWRDVATGAELEMCEGLRVVGVATVERGLAHPAAASSDGVDQILSRHG